MDAAFIKKLENAIDNEWTAAWFYTQLQKQADVPLFKYFIEHALDDEIKHFKWFQELHFELTGAYYKNAEKKKDYKTFKDGIEKALVDELEAAEFYREMLFEIPIEAAYKPLFKAMGDELEHAIRFSTIYSKI